ncbi:hypothetical protein PDR5_40070 [Pseudomonas sp. DR 5-09]|nr:hypothetical protein PDR5_40070 [Pseudomonas sp. DR 5-09]
MPVQGMRDTVFADRARHWNAVGPGLRTRIHSPMRTDDVLK